MSALIAKIVQDCDGQAIILPEGENLFDCQEVVVERAGKALIVRPHARVEARRLERVERIIP